MKMPLSLKDSETGALILHPMLGSAYRRVRVLIRVRLIPSAPY
ncbi:Uncharacterised protein [Mycobacteroides abscessus subsp. massiliense]|nr:Uncharacterised protein [Mycobacteroides abscessus subsp. massiliense]SKV65600.1 Uncharacterised protein [Mycobacteroides abscessus subsp. abscessus]SKE37360.1 Uncharacterised protein [Mycobacteroides abscessus subsp. massiliense]SKF17493.1 Uncharacterised protein [Mycobacteroides abscessus subsp. massiliense]SKF98609.1 Uncharacterised protein [Mycobacteroides abscessus subsp. massiliense]